MNDRTVRVSVRILEKDYQVACPPEERAALLDAAELLSGKMREIRDSSNVVGVDRIAVLAGLNLANELLALRGRDDNMESGLADKVRQLRERLETALNHGRQLEI
jgi:cell division protein ZapA